MSNYIKAQSRGVHEFELKDEKKLRHFPRLVEFAESKRKRVLDHGLFKIHAPREWVADQTNFRDENHRFRMQQETWQPCVNPDERGCFVRVAEDGDQITKEEFQALATRPERQPDPAESGRMTIGRFFPRRQRHIDERKLSGTVTGSRFSDSSHSFDIRNLKSVLNLGTLQNGQLRQESGITTPAIVYGSYGSTIPLQTGYMGLYTVSYSHGGKPRVWYVIHTKQGNIARFEQALRQAFRQDFIERGVNRCGNPLQHHQWIVAPSFLQRHTIRYSVVVQQAGDIVVILPKVGYWSFVYR